MRILGIDPGYGRLGYGVIDSQNNRMVPVDFGVVETYPEKRFPERLEEVYQSIQYILEKFKPDVIAFEELFFYHNITTAISVGAARGVALLAGQQSCKPLYEFTPMQIKLAVTGNGNADKKAVQNMVRMYLNLKSVPKPDDAADALACAICFHNTMPAARDEFLIK